MEKRGSEGIGKKTCNKSENGTRAWQSPNGVEEGAFHALNYERAWSVHKEKGGRLGEKGGGRKKEGFLPGRAETNALPRKGNTARGGFLGFEGEEKQGGRRKGGQGKRGKNV